MLTLLKWKLAVIQNPLKCLLWKFYFHICEKLCHFSFKKIMNYYSLLSMIVSHLRDFHWPVFDSLHVPFNCDLIDRCIVFTITLRFLILISKKSIVVTVMLLFLVTENRDDYLYNDILRRYFYSSFYVSWLIAVETQTFFAEIYI